MGRLRRALSLGVSASFCSVALILSASQVAQASCDAPDNVCYNGGAVIHKVVVDEIFWLPSGLHYEPTSNPKSSDSNYENLVQRFIRDIGGSPFYNIITQ